MAVRLGSRLPNMGAAPMDPGLAQMARVAEASGVEALHLSDHVVLPGKSDSRYPFTADGQFPWDPDSDWYDTFTSCAWVAASTSTVEVGPSVLVLPQRRPLEVAKAAATLSRLSVGRLFLGVGAGWLEEEFTALGADFANRADGMLEAIDILRLAWSGTGDGYAGSTFSVPEGTHCRPLPDSAGIPVLMGGMSNAALRRAARYGDGWIALMGADGDIEALTTKLGRLRSLRAEEQRSSGFTTIIRLVNYGAAAAETGRRLREMAEAGFDEIVVDPGWADLNASARMLTECRAVLDRL